MKVGYNGAMKYLMPCIAFLIAGCGGNGGGTTPSNNWTGTLSPGGNMSLSIVGGNVSGTLQGVETGTVAGTKDSATLSFTVDFPTEPDLTVTGSRGTGLVIRNTRISGGMADSREIDLNRQ